MATVTTQVQAQAQALRKQFLLVTQKWPKDPLRPDLSFPNFLHNRIEYEFGTAGTSAASENQTNPLPPLDLTYQKQQLNALQTLLDNRYKTQYPVSENLLRPASNPDYYDKLIRELEVAPKRSWWAGFVNSWKGYIRMS